MITGHGGNVNELSGRLGCPVADIADMSSNLNPLGPPPGFEAFIAAGINTIRSLPEADGRGVIEAFSRCRGIDPARVAAGNGTTWFIYTLPLALALKKVLVAGPTYADYRDACRALDVPHYLLEARERDMFRFDIDRVDEMADRFDAVFICNPNNPTGTLLEKDRLIRLAEKHGRTLFVVDESYMPFVDGADTQTLVGEPAISNLVVLFSVSKIFTVPGLRCGFMTAAPDIIDRVMRFYQPWSVNALAQKGAVWLFENESGLTGFILETRAFLEKERNLLFERLGHAAGITLFPSATSFVLAKLTGRLKSADLCRFLGDRRILIRDCTNFKGLSDRFVRFSLKTAAVNERLAHLVKAAVDDNDAP